MRIPTARLVLIRWNERKETRADIQGVPYFMRVTPQPCDLGKSRSGARSSSPAIRAIHRCAFLCAFLLAIALQHGCGSGVDLGPAGPIAGGGSWVGQPDSGSQPGGSGSPSAFACDRKAAVDPGPAPLQRLTPAQYAATAHDLFGSDLELADVLPAEASASHIGLAQPDPSLVDVENYAAAARRVREHVESNVARFAPCTAGTDAAAARGCALRFLERLGPRIYRGALEGGDIEGLLTVFGVGYQGSRYASGIGLMVQAMLQAPRFLYRPELGDLALEREGAVPLTGYEVASRLSFAFWNSGPDEALLEAARTGVLDTSKGVAEQALRLSADPRAQQSFRDFLRVWFGLSDWDTVEKDPRVFPSWSEQAQAQLDIQSEAFFDAVLFKSDGTLGSLFGLDAAAFAPAGMEDWMGQGDGSAKGLLSLPALLSRHSKPTESFPIYRGLFVREQLLCQALPPPPNNVGDPPEPATGVTSRERFEQHSSDPACRGCHTLIDPLGFAFENYDAIGRFRKLDEGHAIDASGQLVGTDVDGPFADLAELSDLLASSETVRACTARQWFRFTMQRFEQTADGCSMRTLTEAFAESGESFEALRTAIVQTPAFRMRRKILPEDD